MATALVTGASSGLGRGFATALAEAGHNLILVARDRERLDALGTHLTAQHGVVCDVLPADLTDPGQRGRVERRLAETTRPVEILINNAGFGINQDFVGGNLMAEQQLINIHIVATMRLCHAVLPGMVERGRGAVINVSSMAGWATYGTYSAAKAWVTTFTEGLATELAGTGVTATVSCPGLIHTEFHERANIDEDIPEVMWLSVDDVVAQTLKDARRGRTVSVTGPQYQVLSTLMQYSPRPIIRRASGFNARRRRND